MSDALSPYSNLPRYLASVLLLLIIFYMVFLEPYNLQKTENRFDFFSSEDGSVKIAFIGDIHYAYDHGEYFQHVVDAINSEEPDLILIGGDIIDGMGENELENIRMLADMHSGYGTYAVLGNHDYFYMGCSGDCGRKVKAELENIGIEVLENENRLVNIRDRSFVLAGVDDLWAGRSNYSKAVEGAGILPRIILAHNQYSAINEDLEGRNIILSAHTHCGYIYIPYITDMMTKAFGVSDVVRGHSKLDEKNELYVTCGIAPDIRFNNPPEVSIIYLE